jgi:hypothetical protein
MHRAASGVLALASARLQQGHGPGFISTSHTFAESSEVASRLPSGLQATPATARLTRRVSNSLPVSASHLCRVLFVAAACCRQSLAVRAPGHTLNLGKAAVQREQLRASLDVPHLRLDHTPRCQPLAVRAPSQLKNDTSVAAQSQ